MWFDPQPIAGYGLQIRATVANFAVQSLCLSESGRSDRQWLWRLPSVSNAAASFGGHESLGLIWYQGLSENSVPLNPMGNDHYPY